MSRNQARPFDLFTACLFYTVRARTILFAAAALGMLILAACSRFPGGQSATRLELSLDRPLRIEARGGDFEWSFRYLGADGLIDTEDDVVSHQQLHLPLGATVELLLESDDYIYTFSVPGLNLKEIAVPDLTFSLEFQSSRPGAYDLPADPMCGFRFLHDDSMGQMTVESVEQFEQWYLGQRAAAQ